MLLSPAGLILFILISLILNITYQVVSSNLLPLQLAHRKGRWDNVFVSMNKQFFAGIGVVVIILLVAGGAYFLGLRLPSKPAQQDTEVASGIPESLSNFTPEPPQDKGVNAGGAVSFPTYNIVVPPSWIVTGKHDNIKDIDELRVFQGEYEIKIFQGATGGALCLYPGDVPFEGPSAEYASYEEFTTSEGKVFRRSGDVGDTGYTVCERSDDGSFFQPTSFGHMSYSLPQGFDEQMLVEIDSIVSSITKN